MTTVSVRILDDLGRPEMEGVESFQLVLKMPMGASLRHPSKATIHINDTVSDGMTLNVHLLCNDLKH